MMSGPELPYKISSSEEALALLRKSSEEALALPRKIINRIDDLSKRFDNLCDNLCLHLDKVHHQNQTMLRNSKLQIQPQAVPVSNFSILIKPTSRKIFASSDMATDLSSGLDYGVAIAPGFRGSSNHDPHISRLRTQTRFFTPLSCDIEPDTTKPNPRKIFASSDLAPDLDPVQAIAPVFSETSKFFTPLQCDLEPEINKPTSRKIDVSSNLSPDPSSDIASRNIVVSSDLDPDPSAGLNFTRVISQGFNEPYLLNSSWRDFETIDKERKLSSQLWYAGQKRVWLRMAGTFMTTYFFAYDLSHQLWLRMAVKFMTTYFFAKNMSN